MDIKSGILPEKMEPRLGASASKPIKIAILSYPMTGTGGAEKVVARLSFALSDQFDFVFACPIMSTYSNYKIPHQGKLIEIDVKWNVATKNMGHRIGKIFYRIGKLIRFIREENPDLILSNSIFVWHHLIVTVKLLHLTRKKVILRFGNHVSVELNKRSKIYTWLLQMGMSHVDGIIASSQGIADELHEKFGIAPAKITIINNPIPIEEIVKLAQETVTERPFHNPLPIILNVSRLATIKNLPLLIRAFHQTLDHIDANLVLVGAGPEESALRNLVNDLNLQDHVFFLGWQQNPFKYMRTSTVFVLTSDYEGFGNVIVEAMVCGCPVIATDCPYGPSEILNGGTYGVLTPVGDEAALAYQIRRLLSDDLLRSELATKAIHRANDFDVEAMAAQYAHLFYELGASR